MPNRALKQLIASHESEFVDPLIVAVAKAAEEARAAREEARAAEEAARAAEEAARATKTAAAEDVEKAQLRGEISRLQQRVRQLEASHPTSVNGKRALADVEEEGEGGSVASRLRRRRG